MANNKIKLIIGPSSSGKSTFIKNAFDKSELNVIMANKLESVEMLEQDCIVHYNTFRPYKNTTENISNEFLDDPALKLLLEQKDNLDIFFLVLNKSSLLKRIILRKKVEPLFNRIFKRKYPSNDIFDLVCHLDYEQFYEKWFDFFEKHSLSYRLISSCNDEFRQLSGLEEAREIIKDNKKEVYSKEEVQSILKRYKFGYQKIDLPYGLSTKGNKRDQSLELIFKDNIRGKSLLDVGCAYGYFCFEAEKRYAKEVYGTELKTERFVGANIIKEVMGSDVNFLDVDIFEQKFERTFDVIIFLNVIHHLKYPVYALKVLSDLCNEKLIIEFPTIGDKKFQASFKDKMKDKNLPLIGVSLYGKYDQTFLFNDEALRRILLEHDNLFSKVEFMESPFEKERRIAICYK